MKQITKFAAVLAFIADLITIGVFVKDILFSKTLIASTQPLYFIGLILVIFVFALGLFILSKEENDDNIIIAIFSFFYVSIGAFILGVVSYRFIVISIYSPQEFFGYFALVGLISGLGYITSTVLVGRTDYLALPFMIIAAEQIILIFVQIISQTIEFGLSFIDKLILLVFTGGIIFVFLLPKDED